MEKQEFWNAFTQNGKISDYLKFKAEESKFLEAKTFNDNSDKGPDNKGAKSW